MKLKAKRIDIKATSDMTAMIDVVFQLIIFFLVSTTFAVLPGIKLNLPESETAESVSNLGITITIEKNGDIYFNDKKVNCKTLETELSSFDTKKISKKDFPITIEADSLVTNGMIVKIFDVVRKSGFSEVSLRTTPSS